MFGVVFECVLASFSAVDLNAFYPHFSAGFEAEFWPLGVPFCPSNLTMLLCLPRGHLDSLTVVHERVRADVVSAPTKNLPIDNRII